MRIVFKILTLGCLLFSLFALILPIVIMFAKGNISSWQGYLHMGVKSIPHGVWGEVFETIKYPEWLTVIYWAVLIGALLAAWLPRHR